MGNKNQINQTGILVIILIMSGLPGHRQRIVLPLIS